MKKLIIVLMVLGVIFAGVMSSKADTTRTIPHKFRTFTANTAVAQGATIYRITGVTTAANGVFGVYNSATLGAVANTNLAIEGGEGTAGDALPHYYFGEEGISLDTGMSVVVSNCNVTIEYL